MPSKHNFYIVNKDFPLNRMAEAFYGGEKRGFYEAFLAINQSVCPKGLATVGQTLYLPSINDNHSCHMDDLKNLIHRIDGDTQTMSTQEKVIKALNHIKIALTQTGNIVGGIGSLIAYRIGRIESTINDFDGELADWFRTSYPENRSISGAIDIARRGKFNLEREVGSLTRLSFKRTPHFVTGVTERLKLRYDMAKQGIVQTHMSSDDWTLEGWEKYHLSLNRIGRGAKVVGAVGLVLAGVVDAMNIAASCVQHGWSNQFGQDVAKNTGDFGGIWAGGKIGGETTKYALKRGLGRTILNFSVNTLEDIEGAETLEAVAGAGAAVLLSPEVAIVSGAALIVGVGYVGAKYGAEFGAYVAGGIYSYGHHVFNFFEKRYYQ